MARFNGHTWCVCGVLLCALVGLVLLVWLAFDWLMGLSSGRFD